MILRGAILRDSSFGDSHNLEVFQDGGVYVKDYNQDCNLSAAFMSLSQNNTIADALSGESWSDRVKHSVYLLMVK